MEYGWPGWRGSSAPAAPLPPVATIANRDHHPQKASMLDEVFTALNVLAEGDQNFTAEIEDNKFKEGQPKPTMHAGATYDGHRIISWPQIPYNGHHAPSEPQSGVGHLPYMSQASAQQVPNSQQQSFGQPPQQQFPRPGVNEGIFPSSPFSTSGQVMSPPSHGGGLVSAASHPPGGSMEHHSPNSTGYTTPHDVYTTPPPSQPPHTPAKSPSSFQNGSSDLSSSDPSPHKDDVVLSPQHQGALSAVAPSPTTAAITTGPPPLIPVPTAGYTIAPSVPTEGYTIAPSVPTEGYTIAPSVPNSAQVISVNQFPQDQSDKKLAVPPISTLLTPVSANNAPSTMHINANPPPISQPENLSQEVHATVLPPLETVIREDHHHKRAYIQQLPEQTELPPHLSNHLPHPLSQQARIEMIMPDIIQTHACHKCRRIECSCEADMEMNNIHKSRLQCERCHKSFSYEKRLEQHLDACRVKGGPGAHYQEVQKSADPNLRCRCGKQFKSIRWLEWHKENKCSVIDKNAKLEEFRQKVEQLQARAVMEARQERGEHIPQHVEPHNYQQLPEYNSVGIKQEFDVKSNMQCRKCSMHFHDEALLEGHEHICRGSRTDGTVYAKDSLALMSTVDSAGSIKRETFNNDTTVPPGEQTKKKHVTGGDAKPRFQCEHCDKSFTLMTNKNRHVRKAHGPQQPISDNRSTATTTVLLSRNSDNNRNNSSNNQYAAESGDLNANTVNVQSHINAPNVLVSSSPKTDNTLLIAALNQGIDHPDQQPPPPTSMISELLNVINQSGSLPVEANEPANQQSSSTSQIPTSVAHSANQIPQSVTTQATNHVAAQLQQPTNEISASPTDIANNIPAVPDLTYEDKKHQVVVTVTAAKQNENIIMGNDDMMGNAATTSNENTSVAISESYIDSGLGTPSPTFKARAGGGGGAGGRGRRKSHMTSYDPTAACSSPSQQSSDGSTNGDGQQFPTRLHQGRYVCGICEASFTFQTNLTRHQRKLHGKPYVRNPRKGERESPNHRESRSPTSHAEMTSYEPYMNAHHIAHAHHETPAYRPEAPIHHDVMLNQDSSLSNDNTEVPQMMEQPQTMVKVEAMSNNGSPPQQFPDINYEAHTIPYNAL